MASGCSPLQSEYSLLIVSSDEVDRRSLDRILKPDCHLHRAATRHEAKTILRRLRPAVVICDQQLTDGNWRDLLTDLQREKGGPPLIVSSHLADDRLWAEVLNLGGYDLLIKPFVPAEVSRVVQMAARRGAQAGEIV